MKSAATRSTCSSLTDHNVIRNGECRVLVAGGSGLIGSSLIDYLNTRKIPVRRLVRRAPRAAGECFWDPAKREIDGAALAEVGVVVNLAGANVGEGRWTPARRAEIQASRVDSTRTLVQAMERARERPKVFVCASATGIYGARGEEVLTEDSPVGTGFLAEVCRAWETEALAAERAGVRTVCARFGVVLSPAGGALVKLLPVFRLGLGGRIGDGRQWMSWIGVEDAVAGIVHATATPACSGPVNFTAPVAVRNEEFTAVLTRALHRPGVVAVPAWILRAALGRMADETILASVRAVPGRLLATGYEFHAKKLGEALPALLTRPG